MKQWGEGLKKKESNSKKRPLSVVAFFSGKSVRIRRCAAAVIARRPAWNYPEQEAFMGLTERVRETASYESKTELVKVFSAHERFAQGLDTNCQTNWKRNGDGYVRQELTSHRIGSGITREIAHELNQDRDVVIFEKVTNPILCFSCQEKELFGEFLIVSWFSLVGKPGQRTVEQLTFFLYGFTTEQAELVPQELLSRQEFLPLSFGENAVSFKQDIDLLSPNDNFFLNTFNTLLTDWQKQDPKNQILLEQTKGLEARRDLVHSGKLKEFETQPKIIWVMVNGKKEARIADFDHIKQCYVWRRETTNDLDVLSSIIKTEEMITLGWRIGKPMVIRSGIGLSARTAGKIPPENNFETPPDMDAISDLGIDENGNVWQRSKFVPRTPENQKFKQEPMEVTGEYYPQLPASEPFPMLPAFPPFSPGGGFNPSPRSILGGGLPVRDGSISERKTRQVSPEVFVLGLAAPATFGFLGETINHLAASEMGLQDNLTAGSDLYQVATTGVIKPGKEAEGLTDYKILEAPKEPGFPLDTPVFPPTTGFSPETPKDGGNGNDGGGGRSLPIGEEMDRKSWGVKGKPPQGWKQVHTPGSNLNYQPQRLTQVETPVLDIELYIGHSDRHTQPTSLPKEMVIYALDMETPQLQVREHNQGGNNFEQKEKDHKTFLLAEGKNSHPHHTALDHSKKESRATRAKEGITREKEVEEETITGSCHKDVLKDKMVTDGRDGLKSISLKNMLEDKLSKHRLEDEVETRETVTEINPEQQAGLLPENLSFWYLWLWNFRNQSLQNFSQDFFLKPFSKSNQPQKQTEVTTNNTLERDTGLLLRNKQPKLKLKTNLAKAKLSFLVLLFLIKLRLAVSQKLTVAGLQKLILTDSLILFLLKPELFLLRKASLVHS